jgi:Mg/Co/Ni transporter MgtE
MTLFTPVTEAPQPANTTSANISNVQASQAKSMPVAEETRISIAKLLKQMPNSPETRILREEFKSIQARLAGVNDDAKAEAIISNGLDSLSKRVMAEPNSDQIIEVMMKMLEEDNQQALKVLKLDTLQSRNYNPAPPNTLQEGRSWGWLN